MLAYKAQPIVLNEATRKVLEARVRATTTPQRDVVVARIILLAADGVASCQISRQVRMHESHVAMWRQRFLAEGLAGLDDAPRPGRPPIHDAFDRLKATRRRSRSRHQPSGNRQL